MTLFDTHRSPDLPHLCRAIREHCLIGLIANMLATTGVPESNFNNRAYSMLVAAPSRSVVVYERVPEDPVAK